MGKRRPSEESLRVLTLLKLDARNLLGKVRHRRSEYMHLFSAQRIRDHFPQVFKNRYEGTSLADLKCCSSEVIVALDNFYKKADELRWYLQTTEEMPGTVDERVAHFISELEQLHEVLEAYLNAEVSLSRE